MGRLTIEIPDSVHHQLRVMAANWGVTIKDYVLEKITPELNISANTESSLETLAAEWEERRKEFKLQRGDRTLGDVIRTGHKW